MRVRVTDLQRLYSCAVPGLKGMGAVAGLGDHKCEICGARFDDIERLVSHLREHSSGA